MNCGGRSPTSTLTVVVVASDAEFLSLAVTVMLITCPSGRDCELLVRISQYGRPSAPTASLSSKRLKYSLGVTGRGIKLINFNPR